MLSKEREMAGFYITGHPMREYQMSINDPNYKMMSQLIDEMEVLKEHKGDTFRVYSKVTIAGVITEAETRYSKKSGDPFKTFNLEDETGSLSCIVFKDQMHQYRGLMENEQLVKLEGRASMKDGEINFNIFNATDLHGTNQNTSPKKYVIISHKDEEELRKQYEQVIDYALTLKVGYENSLRIPVYFQKDGNELDMGVTIFFTEQTQEDIKNIVGRNPLKAEYV